MRLILRIVIIIIFNINIVACVYKNNLKENSNFFLNYFNKIELKKVIKFKKIIKNHILFDIKESIINNFAKQILQKQYKWLKEHNVISIKIEGHAYELATRQYNIALAAKRAESVKKYLILLGFNASNISIVSFGKEKPISLCNNTLCWSKNRRTVIVIMN